MPVGFPRERLAKLVDLASRPEVPAGELTGEVADLLLQWPDNYPLAMREPFEALLERSLRDIGPERRAMLAARFSESDSIPLSVLNALFFDAAADVRQSILARNAANDGAWRALAAVEEASLLAAARAQPDRVATTLAVHFRIESGYAIRISSDLSALSLAVLCRGAGCSRAVFSALATMARPNLTADETYRRLSAYDKVTENAAAALLRFWQRARESKSLAESIH